MFDLLRCKFLLSTPPAAIVDNASAVFTEVDTAGYDAAMILVGVGATDIDAVALTITESDSAGSGHAAITEFTSSGATGDGRLPQDDDDNSIFAFHLDLRNRKRYLDATITSGDGTAGTFWTAITILYRAADGPLTSTQMGLASLLAG